MDNIIDVVKDESYTSSISQEPVTLAEAKAQCRVDFTDDDDYLTSLITQARSAIESYCNISIVLKTITATINNPRNYNVQYPMLPYLGISRWDYNFYGIGLAGKWFELPYGPVRTLASVTMITQSDPPVINILTENVDFFRRGVNFQEMQIPNWGDNCLIVYYAGYPQVPPDLKRAVLEEIAFRYDSRGDSTNRYARQNVGISEGAQTLAGPYRRIWL